MAYIVTDEQLEECSLKEKLELVTRILNTIGDTKSLPADETYNVLTALNGYTTQIKAATANVQADFEDKVAPFFAEQDVCDFGNLRGSKVTKTSYEIDYENLTDDDLKHIADFVKTSKSGFKFDIKTKSLSDSAKTKLVDFLDKNGLVGTTIKPTYNTYKKYCDKNGLSLPEVVTDEVSITWSVDGDNI